MEPNSTNLFSIRSYRPEDSAACQVLYVEGLTGGRVAPTDTAFDIQDIESAYMKDPGNHFWVAETPEGRIVGTIGVQQHDAGVGEVRRLRVDVPFQRRGIGSALMETALRFCQDHQYLKVKLDTFMDHEAAVRLFQKFRFLHDRTKTLGEKQLMYFYLDLYSRGESAQG